MKKIEKIYRFLFAQDKELTEIAYRIATILELRQEQTLMLVEAVLTDYFKPIDIEYIRRQLGDFMPGIVNEATKLFGFEENVTKFYKLVRSVYLEKRRYLLPILNYYYAKLLISDSIDKVLPLNFKMEEVIK